jgi:hypothetical protein
MSDDAADYPPFTAFPKITRLHRAVVITEKLDGISAAVIIAPYAGAPLAEWTDLEEHHWGMWAQYRNRYITAADDRFGFVKWITHNSAVLRGLGPGTHHGEWWGQGINRGYGLKEKRFSLFDLNLWQSNRPPCCSVVPTIIQGTGFRQVDYALAWLRGNGSLAAPGFREPEGIMAYHAHSNSFFKATLENDELPKTLAEPRA